MKRGTGMRDWMRRSGRAVGTGLTWAVLWAPVAVLVGLIVDPDNSMDEMWVAIGAYPGFLCGVLFAMLLGIAERGRRIDEVSPLRLAALGAAAGLPVGALPFAIGDYVGELPLWMLASTVVGCITLMSAASAVGSARVSRSLRRHRLGRA